MKTVLVAKYMNECNTFVPGVIELPDCDLQLGQGCLDKLQTGDVFERRGVKVIPSLYERSNKSGIISKLAFDYIEGKIIKDVKAHLSEIDGIFLFLHGASEVEEIGSGEHHILKEVRKVVGPYMPIGVACDPHGNLCKEYVDNCTIIRSYRESPHTDIEATAVKVCELLIDQIEHPTNVKPVYRKLPLILGGEQSVSTDEPVRSFNQYMDEMEKDPKILSATFHVGYIRHDTDVAGCGIVVIPTDGKYQDYAEQKADELYDYIWNKRHEFHYSGITEAPEKALQMALDYTESPVFITDSGDNVTSRAKGENTTILKQMLGVENLTKKVLFASISDANTCAKLWKLSDGEETTISLGTGTTEYNQPVELDVVVKFKGEMNGRMEMKELGKYGKAVLVSVKGTTIDIIVAANNNAFTERQQTEVMQADWMNYDIVVCKMGYSFPQLLRDGKLCVMSLTLGDTIQDITKIPFKRIMRPMYPIDNI